MHYYQPKWHSLPWLHLTWLHQTQRTPHRRWVHRCSSCHLTNCNLAQTTWHQLPTMGCTGSGRHSQRWCPKRTTATREEEETEKERIKVEKEEQKRIKPNIHPSWIAHFPFNNPSLKAPPHWENLQKENTVIPDSKLHFNNFLIAIPYLIEAMGWAQWPKEWILMMSHFWDNILNHPHHSSGIPEDK